MSYPKLPTEVNDRSGAACACSPAFTGRIELQWPTNGELVPRVIYLSCGDSPNTGLADQSIDLVVTDPPFFDNVHYSELADFFFAWQPTGNLSPLPSGAMGSSGSTTRHSAEVQDGDADKFAEKLQAVFRECHRVMRDDGLLVFIVRAISPQQTSQAPASWRRLIEMLLQYSPACSLGFQKFAQELQSSTG